MSAATEPIRILAVDDHPIVRRGIAGLVSIQPDMILVGEATDGREAIQLFRTHRPDVTLMDLQMPEMNGVDALIAIRNEFPDAKIIVLTTYKSDTQIIRALKAGAQGYLLKNTLHKELLETIRGIYAGKKALSPEVSYEIATHATDDTLTPAEISVLRLIAAGNANKQIADELSVTEETVKSRVKCILSKLGANDRTQAAMIGVRQTQQTGLSEWGICSHSHLPLTNPPNARRMCYLTPGSERLGTAVPIELRKNSISDDCTRSLGLPGFVWPSIFLGLKRSSLLRSATRAFSPARREIPYCVDVRPWLSDVPPCSSAGEIQRASASSDDSTSPSLLRSEPASSQACVVCSVASRPCDLDMGSRHPCTGRVKSWQSALGAFARPSARRECDDV